VAAHVPSYALAAGVAVTAIGLMTKVLFSERKLFAAFSTCTHHQNRDEHPTKLFPLGRGPPMSARLPVPNATLAQGTVNDFGNLAGILPQWHVGDESVLSH
jgi:hypothetical protein